MIYKTNCVPSPNILEFNMNMGPTFFRFRWKFAVMIDMNNFSPIVETTTPIDFGLTNVSKDNYIVRLTSIDLDSNFSPFFFHPHLLLSKEKFLVIWGSLIMNYLHS